MGAAAGLVQVDLTVLEVEPMRAVQDTFVNNEDAAEGVVRLELIGRLSFSLVLRPVCRQTIVSELDKWGQEDQYREQLGRLVCTHEIFQRPPTVVVSKTDSVPVLGGYSTGFSTSVTKVRRWTW